MAEDSKQEPNKKTELFPHSVELTKGQKTGPERRWMCRACPAGCAYYSRDKSKPATLTRACLQDGKKTVVFQEAV